MPQLPQPPLLNPSPWVFLAQLFRAICSLKCHWGRNTETVSQFSPSASLKPLLNLNQQHCTDTMGWVRAATHPDLGGALGHWGAAMQAAASAGVQDACSEEGLWGSRGRIRRSGAGTLVATGIWAGLRTIRRAGQAGWDIPGGGGGTAWIN